VTDTDAARRLAYIALGLLVEPGNRALGLLVRKLGPVEALRWTRSGNAPPDLAAAIVPRLAKVDPFYLAETAVTRAERLGARILTPDDDEWPDQWDDLAQISRDVPDVIDRDTFPPLCVWARGPLALGRACDQAVSVVGSRASTDYGNSVATELAYGVAEQGWTVVSGGAFGIDAAAHRGALAADGRTVAVFACGIDRWYPQANGALFDRIAESGLLVSEWPPGSDPHRRRFLIRNRVIAASSRGTVMVEASVRSGARFTLNRAGELDRAQMVVPGPVTSAMSVGCHEALREENTILVAAADQVIEAVGRIGADLAAPRRVEPTARDQLTPLQAQVLEGVRPRKLLSAEQIAAAAGVSERQARRVLPGLERLAFVTESGGAYRLRRLSDGNRRFR
jgi:DNA processing protein